MQVGIEVSYVTDTTTGKRGIRVVPYLHATKQQKQLVAAAVVFGLFLGSMMLLGSIVSDPIIKPEVVLIP